MQSTEFEKDIADLQQQFNEQESAINDTRQLLEADADDEELQGMLKELLDSLQETHSLINARRKLRKIALETKYRFRHTDGRWHYGIAKGKDSGRVLFHFLRPTKIHMLSGSLVEPGLIKPVRAQSPVDLNLHAGTKLLASSRNGLWLPAELLSSSQDGHKVMFCDDGATQDVRNDEVARSAYATDSSCDSREALESKSGSSEPDVESTDSEDDPDEDTAFDLDLRLQSHSEAGPSQAGPQTETQTFGSFERHTRGMGSKLMVNMGYVKGGTLGRHAGGQLNPIQVELFRPGAGLGSEGAVLGSTSSQSSKKRSRGGAKRRKVRQKFQQREARRQADHLVEQETGETGVFALVNKRLGDHSEAAKIQRKSLESQTRGMNWSRDSKFGQQGQAQAPQDRKSLVASRDGLAAKRAKIAHLEAMSIRNQKDAVMSKQIRSKLRQAQAELGQLQESQQSGVSALLSQEKQKKWLKF